MNKIEVLEFINQNPVFALATLDGTRPKVRYMMTALPTTAASSSAPANKKMSINS